MSKASSIKAWLNHPNRTKKKGLDLFGEYSTNINLMRFMKRLDDNDKVISILDVQLRQLIGLSVLPPQVDIKPVKKDDPIKERVRKLTDVFVVETKKLEGKQDPFGKEPGSRPEVLLPIYKAKDEAYVEAKNLHSMLVAKGDEMDKLEEGTEEWQTLADDRKEMALKIIELFNQVNASWKQIDYFKEHGKLPEKELLEEKPDIKADTEDPIQLDRRWRTIGSYISKAKKNPERNQEKLKELYAESNEIAEKLNKMAGEEKYKMRNYETPPAKTEENTDSE